jgi:hypothetical protein
MKIWTMKTITMKIKKITLMDFTSWNEQPWDYASANGVKSLFWLVGYTFCDNMSPWNDTLATMKNDTCDLEKWYKV